MEFILPIKVTKELLLSKYPEETYMEYYLGIKVRKGLFISPLRKDNHPTCSFYRNKSGTLIFKDFSGEFYGDFVKVVMTKYNCKYYKALQIIANDFGIVKTPNLPKSKGIINKHPEKFESKEDTIIQVEVQDFTEKEISWWEKFGINKSILKKFNVYSCKNVFLNGKVIASTMEKNPIFGYYGFKHDGIELWRIYFPKRKNYRFLSNWKANKIQGYLQLPKEGKLLVITKSMKDVMCLYSMGITAIAPNSENLFIQDNVLNDLKNRFKYIVVLYDNDRPGLYNLAKIRKSHPELNYVFIPLKYGAKDISDFYKKYKRKDTILLIKEYLQWLNKTYKHL